MSDGGGHICTAEEGGAGQVKVTGRDVLGSESEEVAKEGCASKDENHVK